MAEKSRNFRSSYYDKVGFRGVEEKKALEILLNEQPMDVEKLSKFCKRFTLPSMYREYVWQVVLGVLPCDTAGHKSVMIQRTQHYGDIKNCLKAMRRIDESTPKPKMHVLMYLMTCSVLEFDLVKQLASSSVQSLIAVAEFFMKISSSELVSFWLFRFFNMQSKCVKSLVENLEAVLKKEDEVLFDHLKLIKAFDILPFNSWLERCFALVLHENSLVRVFDRIVGGSSKILPYVGVALLLIHRNQLLSINNPDEIEQLLVKNSEETSDVIVTKAFDMYST